MANDMTFNQVATILKGVTEQATGQTQITPANTAEFVTVGQAALKTGYDPLMGAISQMVSRTIFSIRPYTELFKGMNVDEIRYGNMVRKVYPMVNKPEDDQAFKLKEIAPGAVDHYKLTIPGAVQVNYYGQNPWVFRLSITRQQLNSAFSGPEEFGSFWSMIMDAVTNDMVQAKENMRRGCLANYVGGKIAGDADSCFHLKTEYAALTGIDKGDIEKPGNYTAYVQWLYGRVAYLSSMMRERTNLYHTNLTGKEHLTHTPYEMQRVYLLASDKFAMEKRAIADVYHDNYLRLADSETVNFWQSPTSPDEIKVTPVYLQADGTLKTDAEEVDQKNILGIICDRDAFGDTMIDEHVNTTPLNADGDYYNMVWHSNHRWWNSFMEKGIVLLND